MEMAKQYKLSITALLNAIDRRDFNWLSKLPEDEAKEFKPLIALRFAASLKHDSDKSAVALWLLNERANNHLFDLGKHPDLVFRLLASCGIGRMQREFLKLPSRRSPSNKAVELLYEHHPFANSRDIDVLLKSYSREAFKNFVLDCGKSDKDISEIMKSYDTIKG